MKINKKLFKKDYFISWSIRKKFAELYRRCYRYCVLEKLEHEFDQYGYIKKEHRYANLDDLEPRFSGNVDNVSRLIAEIRGLNYSLYDIDYAKQNKYYNPHKLMDAKFPHVHWAYYCMKHGYTPQQREEYYTNQIKYFSGNKTKSDLFITVEFPKIYHKKWTGINFMIKKAEELLRSYGETNLIGDTHKHKIVFFTGSGISKESGIPTFRDSDGLWEQYPVELVASANGYYQDPLFVNDFYNKLRQKYNKDDIKPNSAHTNIVKLASPKINEWNEDYKIKSDNREREIVIITQNVDDLHERAIQEIANKYKLNVNDFNIKIIHLHGELMTMCSEGDVTDTKYHVQLPYNGKLELPVNTRVKDIFTPVNVINEDKKNKEKKILIKETEENWEKHKDKLMRPYVVFFGEDVPKINDAIREIEDCDAFVVIGTSLQVYPAANLINYVPIGSSIVYIDPTPQDSWNDIQQIKTTATTGMDILLKNWLDYVK